MPLGVAADGRGEAGWAGTGASTAPRDLGQPQPVSYNSGLCRMSGSQRGRISTWGHSKYPIEFQVTVAIWSLWAPSGEMSRQRGEFQHRIWVGTNLQSLTHGDCQV